MEDKWNYQVTRLRERRGWDNRLLSVCGFLSPIEWEGSEGLSKDKDKQPWHPVCSRVEIDFEK